MKFENEELWKINNEKYGYWDKIEKNMHTPKISNPPKKSSSVPMFIKAKRNAVTKKLFQKVKFISKRVS